MHKSYTEVHQKAMAELHAAMKPLRSYGDWAIAITMVSLWDESLKEKEMSGSPSDPREIRVMTEARDLWLKLAEDILKITL